LLKAEFKNGRYQNQKLAELEKRINDLYDKELSKKVFWECIGLLYRDKKPFYWVDNLIYYILTGQIIATKDSIQLYPENGYIRLEIQPEATCREHYRKLYSKKYPASSPYLVLSSCVNQYTFDTGKELPRAYIKNTDLVREFVVLEIKGGYSPKEFNEQWRDLVEPLQRDIIRRRGFIKSPRIKSTYDTVLKDIKEGKEIKAKKPNTRISVKSSYYKRKDSLPRWGLKINKSTDEEIQLYERTINSLKTYPDNIDQILKDYGLRDKQGLVRLKGTKLPKSFKDKMINTGHMNKDTLNTLEKDINVLRGEQKDYLDSKLKKDKYRTAKRRYSPKKPVHT
jgi:hypothetical protein